MTTEDDESRGELFRGMKERRKQEKAANVKQARQALVEREIFITEHNNGTHWKVKGADGYIDFWPSTGRWIVPGGKKGFGVNALIKHIKGA